MRKNRSTQLIAAAVLALAFSVQPAQGGISQPIRAQTQEASAPLAPGDLDPSFGEDGLVTTDMNRNSAANALVLQPDGKLVAAGKVVAGMGTGELDAKYDFALTRHNSDGGLDETFGAGGLVTTDFGEPTDIATSLALQDDGKIIAAGEAFTGIGPNGWSCAIARYDEDGVLDPSFGTGGKATVVFGRGCQAVALQSDGKIVAAGGVPHESVQGKWGIGLLRFNSDGSLDNDFGVDGIVKTYSDDYQLGVNSIHIVSDDKIIAAGGAGNNSMQEFALARYDSDGNLDASFGTDGIAVTAFGDANISFASAIQTDGKFLMTGIAAYDGRNAFSVVRFTGDGELDADFGTDGRTVTDVGGYGGYGNTVLIQPDDKIVVTGGCYLDRKYVALVRYDSDGELDESFGTDGISTAFWGGDDNSDDSVLQTDGKIVLGGYAINQFNISNMILARFDSLGALDSDFGAGGLITTRFLGSFDTAYALALQPDGKAVVAGASTGGHYAVYSVSRYNSDGSPDDTFGIDGVAYTTIQWSGGHAFGVVIQPDEKIVAVGDTYDGVMYFDFGLARFNVDGSLDTGFGSNGTVATDFAGREDGGTSVTLQPDGLILACGWTNNSNGPNNFDFALARHADDGDLDASFGNGGKVITDFSGFNDFCSALVVQPDGKIVVVGASMNAEFAASDFALVRYHGDGTLDEDFGSGGKATTDFGGTDSAQAMALQPDGKILVSGVSDGSSILVRYNSDGSLDETFGEEGESSGRSGSGGRTGAVSGALDSGRSLAVQYDGMILLGGASGNDFGLARYTEAGELDASFGAGGIVTTDFGGSADQLAALSLQQDGKAVAAGVTDVNGTNDFAAARYFAAPEPKQVYLPVVRR